MKRTAFLYDERYLLHETGPHHPECPQRLTAIYKGIEAAGLIPLLTRVQGRTADLKWVETVHPRDYIERFRQACLDGQPTFDSADNQMCPATFDTALLAVGGILEAARLVMTGGVDNAFCAVRPPGHHAERQQAMGFCYFNNVAILARYLQQEWNVKRIAIIDFDVHHGNGTQHIFETDPSVFYYSIHEHPSFAFPGSGRDFECGVEAGKGFTKNSPVLPGRGDIEYRRLVKEDLLPACEIFSPEVIIASTGFDAHEDDAMSDIQLTTQGYAWLAELVDHLAQMYAQGRLISVLEGGYSLTRLPELARDHVERLMHRDH